MRIVPFISILALLTACHPCKDCQETDTDSCQTCDTSDTGDTSVTGFAPVTVDVFKLTSVTDDALVYLYGPTKDYSLTSGDTQPVDAPGDYTAEAGDPTLAGQFGYPVYMDGEGNPWAAMPVDFSVQLNVPAPVRIDLHKTIEPGTYACGYDKWRYSTSADGHKGESFGHHDLDNQVIKIDQDGKIHPQDNPNMSVVGHAGDEMQLKNDQIVLLVNGVEASETSNPPAPYYLENTVVVLGKSFSVTVVDNSPYQYVADVQCDWQY